MDYIHMNRSWTKLNLQIYISLPFSVLMNFSVWMWYMKKSRGLCIYCLEEFHLFRWSLLPCSSCLCFACFPYSLLKKWSHHRPWNDVKVIFVKNSKQRGEEKGRLMPALLFFCVAWDNRACITCVLKLLSRERLWIHSRHMDNVFC